MEMTYNLHTCEDIDTLNAVYQKLIEPYHDAFNEEIAPIEAQYLEKCKPHLALFDEAVKEVFEDANKTYAQIEAQTKQKMESIRLEALRKIRVQESKLKKMQDKLQAAYYADPVVQSAQAVLKAATQEYDNERDAAIAPIAAKMQLEMEPLKKEYEEVFNKLGGNKVRRVDKS